MVTQDAHMALANLLQKRKNEINKTFRDLEAELGRKNLSTIHQGESLPAEGQLEAFAKAYELAEDVVKVAYDISKKARTDLTASRRSVIGRKWRR